MAGKNGFKMENLFSALSDRTRLRLLNLMRNGEVCVCFFAETLDTNNPKISRHLAYLKRAGLVTGRRDGKWMHYSLTLPDDPQAAEILAATMRSFESDPEMISDLKSLDKVCCALPTVITRVKA